MKQWEKEFDAFYWLDQNTREQLEDLIMTALDTQKAEIVEMVRGVVI